jgi:hypothetical protein
MNFRTQLMLVSICLLSILAVFAAAQTPSSAPAPIQTTTAQKEAVVTNHAKGTFDVKLAPQDDKTGDTNLGRMTIDKQFHGDLEGTSKGQMLTGMTSVKGSAGYVAIEKVTGTLNGHAGSFILQHTGSMNRSVPQLSVTVVPDSGTDQLVGLTGAMKIIITDGKHSYEFDYTLANGN